jgi:hypothetical protein
MQHQQQWGFCSVVRTGNEYNDTHIVDVPTAATKLLQECAMLAVMLSYI